ncbi:hypothetical protein [Paenochrobactrum glaciei]|uniref:Uncharacterized protein n=1 Tax=Paenochrobactrum glaciei TaxID=486407 RepID=A0ABP3R268_9HYPH
MSATDYTIDKVYSLFWYDAEKSLLGGEVEFSHIGRAPCSITANYATQAGRELWDEALAGLHGEIAPYVEPEPEPEPIPEEISRRQFFQQLAVMEIITKAEALSALTSGSIPTALQVIIDQLPTEDDQFNAQMLVIGAHSFNRAHPLAEIVRQAMQWTVEQKDDFWSEAAKL